MKTLIISSGYLPVTNEMGGAIEKLLDAYLLANDQTFKNDITLYSVKTKSDQKERDFRYTKIRVINKRGIFYKINQIVNFILYKITRKYTGNVYIRKIIKDLKQRNELQDTYDCIIVENIGRFVPVLREYTKSKLVLHLHNDYLNIYTENAKKIIHDCDNIWCVSNFICNRVKEVASEKDISKIHLLYNGIDFSLLKTNLSIEQKIQIKKSYGLDPEKKVILYTGRLMPEKGIKELLLAFKQLSKERKDICLLIVGGTKNIKENNNYYVSQLKSIAKHIDNTIIFTGNISYNRLYEVYSIADIQVVPSMCEEAFGLIILEGMYYSIPLIVTNSGGIPELLPNNYEYIVEKDNDIIKSLCEKIKKILNYPEKEEITSKYQDKLSNFTNEFFCKNFNDLMENIKETK